MPDLMINGLRRWLSRLIGHAEIATDLGYGLASTERPSGRKIGAGSGAFCKAPADAELHFLNPGLFFWKKMEPGEVKKWGRRLEDIGGLASS